MTKPEIAEENEENNQPGLEAIEEEALELGAESNQDAEIQRLLEENLKLKDQILRAFADAENTRRMAKRDIEDAGKYAVVSFARDLINVLENFNRAEQNAPTGEDIENNTALQNFLEGISLTKKELTAAFEKQGIKRIDPLNEKFDHNFHQAVAQVESDVEPGTVVSVVQAGYVIRDRLLRPAMVAVSKPRAPKPEGDQPSVDTEA